MQILYFAGVVSSCFFFLLSSPILSRRRLDVYHLECRSEIKCAARGLLKIPDAKKSPQTCHLCTIAQLCPAISLQLRHVSTIRKKHVKHQYLLHMSLQYGELQPTNGWDRFGGLGHPRKFQQVSRLGVITAPTSLTGDQPNFARCLAISWAGTLYIHFRGLLLPDGIFIGKKFTFHPSLAFSYIGSITAWHSSSGHQPNLYKEWNYRTFAEGLVQAEMHKKIIRTHSLNSLVLLKPDFCHNQPPDGQNRFLWLSKVY